MQQEKILYDDAAIKMQAKVFDAAGQIVKEFPVWKGVNDGRFYSDETTAKTHNATHDICSCGNERRKGWTICFSCNSKRRSEVYNKMPVQEWGEYPVCIFDDDQYFFDEESFLDYCEDNDMEPETVRLCGTRPNKPEQIDIGIWSDVISEDDDDPFNKEFHEKLAALNEVIRNHPAVSYSQANKRVKYNSQKTDNDETTGSSM